MQEDPGPVKDSAVSVKSCPDGGTRDMYRQSCHNTMGTSAWVKPVGCRISLPVMSVGAAWQHGPWSGYRTRRGRAVYAREALLEEIGRPRPPASRRRGTSRGGRAGRASADRGVPRGPELG